MEFTKTTRLKDILNLPCFQPMLGQFIASSAGDWFHGKGELSLAELQQQNPTWYWEDVAYGLNRLQKIALDGGRYVYPVGEGTCLIHLPAENRRYEAYAILNAGGAYGAVCTMVEALPAAAKLNELGMDCFCLNYRTATQSSFTEGLMPKPLEDLALAWRYIESNEAAFQLDAENYIVGGFSAGGHLAAMWGAENHGARRFGIPNPRALLLAYPLIGLENLSGPAAQLLRSGLLGIHSGEEKIAEYTASRQVGSGYPPVYLVRAEDDHTVPKQDAADMETALAKAEIPHRIERVPSGGHGFGLGTATAANGWIFWRKTDMRNKMATASMTVTEREKRHAALSAQIAAEGMVLLENKGVLPFPAQVHSIALFGSGARRTVKGGTGSGDVNVRSFVTIEQGLKDAGYRIVTEDWLTEQDAVIRTAKAQYDAHIQELSHQGISVALLTMMGKPFREPELRALNEQDLHPADAAIYVLARNSGEGADRKNAPGDYLLTETEKQDIALLAKRYERFVLLLNVGGVLDLEAVRELPGAIVLVSQGGSGFGTAASKILTGAESPSGRLTATWAKQYSDYPCADEFCVQPEDVWYKEGIFVGYRWFDSFGMEPRYPFGYGLSYTDFAWSDIQVHVEEAQVFVSVTVQNTGNHPGKDVVQIYAAQPRTELPKADKLLVGFAKTGLLSPGEGETVTVSFPCASLASYDEEKSAWVLEQGEYGIYVGKNSRKLQLEAALVLEGTIVTEQCRSLFRGEKADWLFPERSAAVSYSCPKILIDPDSIPPVTHTYTGTPTALSAPTRRGNFSDVVKGSATAAELAGQLTPEELALLCIGAARVSFTDFSVIGNASKSIPGAAGDTTDRLEDYGIPQCAMADGPAGIRVNPKVYQRGDTYINNVEEDPILGKVLPPELRKVDLSGTEIKYQYCTALPVAVQLAQSWNPKLAELAGDIAGAEMEELGIDLWLAPGLNIQRNPLCGRNFEYYSEDPYLSGVFAAAVTKGVQKHPGKDTCIKHLAANNQETCRSTSNSHVSERTLREIYLRGFEICVKEARPFSAMTSMNLLNGVHTANDQDLLTHALRDEWGFDGIVMTDWGTTGQFVSVGEDRKYGPSTPVGCILAGNDLIMPGTKFDEDTLFAAIRDGSLPVAALQDCGKRLIELLVKCTPGRKG